MATTSLHELFDELLEGRRLLSHPFYVRWENGELNEGELGAYASQYRHFEAYLPRFLASVADNVDGAPKAAIQKNLEDELSNPRAHLAMFDAFLESVGGDKKAHLSPAMEQLLSVYQNLATADPVAALSALGAYEVQASDIARSKAEGLVRHYDQRGKSIEFWKVHAEMDADHASWTIDTIAALSDGDDDNEVIRAYASDAAESWWQFLDEREALASSFAAV